MFPVSSLASNPVCPIAAEPIHALPEGNTQFFASRYKLHLPTEEELAAELQRERWQIKLAARLSRDEARDDA